ncbi:MAG TPA: hypothetical protein VLX31_07425 [Streptosporangiaceae bacterium]|nr:hypothetical protein [Streptosporangiaceae bacterium]
MGRTIRQLAGSAVAAAALVLTGGAAAGPRAPHLVGCNESGPVRPVRYNPICNDGARTIIRLHWSNWSRSAAGAGRFYTNTCVPSCARGRVRLYDVTVSAWRVLGGDYTRFRYHFPHRIPRGLPRSWTISYYAGRWHGRLV